MPPRPAKPATTDEPSANAAGTFMPTLRFPEFRNRVAWKATNANELFDAIDRRPAAPGLPVLAITQEHGPIPRDQIDYHVSVADASLASYKEVRPNDFIISLRSFQGGIEYSRHRGICSPAYVILNRKGDGVDDFYRHLFKSDRFIQQLTRNIEGLRDGKMISYAQFSEQLLPEPKEDEQQKIADCLTSLDEVIVAQRRKVEALKAHKKGLMQALFPQSGERVPRLRFPEFRDGPEWEDATVAAAADLVSGVHLAPEQYGPEGEVPYFTGPSDFTNDVRGFAKWTAESSNVAVKHDTLITVKGSGVGELWYSTLAKVAMGRQLMAVRPVRSARRFVHYFLETKRSRLEGLASGNLIPGLSRGDILNMPMCLPDRAEQQRIADCLASLDAAIAAASVTVDALKAHKKGLMQGLFPTTADPTAEGA